MFKAKKPAPEPKFTLLEEPPYDVAHAPATTDQQDRIKAVFHLTSRDPLPHVDEKALLAYHKYLSDHLIFPFDGEYAEDMGHLQQDRFPVTVSRLLGPDDDAWCDEAYGLVCEARHKGGRVDLPLADITPAGRNPNRQLLKDYGHWFWHWR